MHSLTLLLLLSFSFFFCHGARSLQEVQLRINSSSIPSPFAWPQNHNRLASATPQAPSPLQQALPELNGLVKGNSEMYRMSHRMSHRMSDNAGSCKTVRLVRKKTYNSSRKFCASARHLSFGQAMEAWALPNLQRCGAKFWLLTPEQHLPGRMCRSQSATKM